MSSKEKDQFALKVGITYWHYGEAETRRMVNEDDGVRFLDFVSKMDLSKDSIPSAYLGKRSEAILGFLNDAGSKKE